MPTPASKVAKKAVTKRFTSWSFSRYNDYKVCPAKAKYKHLDKLKEPENPAMARGSAIHKLAEDYVKGLLPRLPPELKLFEVEFKALKLRFKKKARAMVVEDNWSFTSSWAQTAWNDWTGCWVRIKLDLAVEEAGDVLRIRDWKTGKFREEKNEEYVEQLELYALAALLLYPHVKEVRPELDYLDEGTTYPSEAEPLVFTHADVPELRKRWEKRVKPMMNDTKFAPRPNNGCRWCHFRAENGGPCKY